MKNIKDSGIVVDLQESFAYVQISSNDACQSCGAAMFCNPGNRDNHQIKVYNSCNARIGDSVQLSEPGNLLLNVSLVQYGLPMLGFLAGIFISYFTVPKESAVPLEIIYLIAGFCGLGMCAIAARKIITVMAGKLVNYFKIISKN